MSTALGGDGRSAAQATSYALQQTCALAGIALLIFDMCLTADLELEYIWARGRARMILLVVTLRHVLLASLILGSITLAFPSPEICTSVSLIASIMDAIPYISWAIFLGWRAYALTSSNALVGLLVFICSLSFAAPSVILVIGANQLYVPTTPPTCGVGWRWLAGPNAIGYAIEISRPMTIFAETIVLILSCRATYRAWLSSRRTNLPASLPDVLYQNGIICFSVGTVLHIATYTLSLDSNTKIASNATLVVFRDVLITIVLSRFIFEIAKVGAQANDPEHAAPGTKGILTTEWMGEISGISSQCSLDEEYNGRGFDKDIDIFEVKKCYEV